MKFTVRDLCWLLLVVGLGLGWYAHAHSPVVVREGDLVYIVHATKIGTEEDLFVARAIAHTVSAKEFRVDLPYSVPVSGVVIHESGHFLGVIEDDKSPLGKVRRIKLSIQAGP